MLVERLDVENVRNIQSAQLKLGPSVNLLTGPNGAGKTALLEAIHLLIRGRSFRTNRSSGLLRHGADRLDIGAGCLDAQQGSVRLRYGRHRDGSVTLSRDGRPIRQSSTVAALIPIQLLLPDLAELIFGGPAGRRQWLDWGAFHVKHEHAANLRNYQRALRHRNALLRAEARSDDSQTLAAWTAQVAEFGELVDAGRHEYFERIGGPLGDCVTALDVGLPVDFAYARGWEGGGLGEVLEKDIGRDIQAKVTNSGPQRADILVRCADEPASATLSRGQGKLVATAMRLAQAQDLMGAGKPSLFLIDDVGAELDQAHSHDLYALLTSLDCQIVATSAHLATTSMLQRDGVTFHVKHGHFELAP